MRRIVMDASLLLIKDSGQARDQLARALAALAPARLETVSDPLEAMEHIRHDGFDAVICGNDLEFIRFLRASRERAIARLPVIVVSERHRREDVARAIDAGADDFIALPVEADLLGVRIAAVLAEERTFIESDLYTGPDRRRSDAARRVALSAEEIKALLGR